MGKSIHNLLSLVILIFIIYVHRKVLDIQGGIKEGNKLITFGNHGAVNQQWFVNSDNTIVSAEGNLALDISGGKLSPGTNIIAWTKHGNANQVFSLQYH